MNTLTCARCEEENAYFEFLDEKGSHYRCLDCGYEWVDFDARSEEDYELYKEAEKYTYSSLSNFLKDIIVRSENLNLNSKQLRLISRLHDLASVKGQYRIGDHISFRAETYELNPNSIWQEILITENGLRLTSATLSNKDNDNGPEVDCKIIFPIEIEEEASNIVHTIDKYFAEFLEKINLQDTEIEVFEINEIDRLNYFNR